MPVKRSTSYVLESSSIFPDFLFSYYKFCRNKKKMQKKLNNLQERLTKPIFIRNLTLQLILNFLINIIPNSASTINFERHN